jgi:hypothetical protein
LNPLLLNALSDRLKKTILLMACVSGFSTCLHAAEAHVHGEALLAVAIDGGVLTLILDSPADNLLGFEHAPRAKEERAALARVKQTLNQADKLFAPTAAAHCKPVDVKLESALFETEAGHTHDTAEHADVEVEYHFQCANPKALRDLEIRLFPHFPGLQKLKAEIVGPNGQKAVSLDRGQTTLSW